MGKLHVGRSFLPSKYNKVFEGYKMKASEKKMLIKHIKKDDKEFRSQIKEDVKLKKQILSKPKTRK